PHLQRLRKYPTAYGGFAHMIEGLVAVQDGRLEQGVRELQQAQQNPLYGGTLYPALGLAYAFSGLGRYDQARTYLEKVEQHFNKYDKLPEEERTIAERLLPNRAALNLELYRCHLMLGNQEKALKYKEKIQDTPEGVSAGFIA